MPWLFLAACLIGPAAAADEPQRECRFCPFETGSRGMVEAGAGWVSDDSFRFGDYTGLQDEGPFGIAGFEWQHAGAEAGYVEATGANLGLDSRSLRIEGGRQGRYRVLLGYRELPKLRAAGTVTPFLGAGGGVLSLPAGWTDSSTTTGMSALAGALHTAEIRHDRRQVDLGAVLIPATRWEYSALYRHETKNGLDRAGGAFVIHSALLLEPVDYTTDQFDVAVRYATPTAQVQLAYYGSLFRNAHDALAWQNPYTPLAPGADQGQMALAPDNQFHQLSLGGSLRHADWHASGRLAYGRARQDEGFVPATVNPNLAAALPRGSTEGTVDVLDASARTTYRVTRRLRLKAELSYDDRDNRTPRDAFPQITADTFTDLPRVNLPYSFMRQALRVSGDLHLPDSMRVSAGIEGESRERSGQAVAETEEATVWGRFRARPAQDVDVALTLSRAARSGSGYTAAPEVQPPPNPLHRIPYLADRDRTRIGMRVDAVPAATLAFGLSADFAEDDYHDSPVGLQQGSDLNVTADAGATLPERLRLQAWASRGVVQWEQLGSQSFAVPDWSASTRDITDSAGVALERDALFGRLDATLRYTWSQSVGEVETSAAAPGSAFPDFDSRRHRIELSGDYGFTPAFSVRLGYGYERYRSTDWQLDGVLPDTIPNVLALGETSPRYGIHLVGLSFVYRFEPRSD